MQHTLRGFFVYLFVIALVFNGGVFHVLANAPAMHAHHVVVTSVELGHQGQHQFHHSAQSDSAIVALGQLPGHGHFDGGAKCCSVCIAVGNLLPAIATTATQFSYQAVVFRISRQHLAGHSVALDPDIPKTIV